MGDAGNDHLEGNAGNDTLFGGSGNDVLIGGDGKDLLYGDNDFDTYIVTNGNTINDKDGNGQVFLDDILLSGGTQKPGESDWKDDSGNTYSQAGDKLYVKNGDSLLTIEGFQNHDLGIHLEDMEDPKKDESTAEAAKSPIVFDLNNDGIATTNRHSGAYFDHDGNGFAEQTGWIEASDGLLVRDLNGNGRIDHGGELFGSNTLLNNGQKAANGYLALAELDGNQDRLLDAQDAAWASLKIWQDANGDGRSSADELFSLADQGIQSIAVDYSDTAVADANGNIIRQTGSFTKTDGSTGSSADVWFETNATYTLATEHLPETAEIAALPDLAGHGRVYDLHQQMLRDSTGRLQGLVEQFMAEADPAARHALITPLLYNWTGTIDIDPNSRSTTVYGNAIGDARIVFSLEALLDDPFLGTWCWGARDPNPNRPASLILTKAFNDYGNTVYAQLAAQTHFKAWFDSIDVSLDNNTGAFVWDVVKTLSLLQAAYINEANGAAVLNDFAWVLKQYGSAGQGILGALRAHGDMNGDEFEVLLANFGLNNLIGDAQDNVLYGTGDGELMLGLAGHDHLYGNGGDDVLDGGLGDDVLQGDAGSDVYRFNAGGGHDVIFDDDADLAQVDILEFGPGIGPADITLKRLDYDLAITMGDGTDRITLQNFGGGRGYQIEQIRFADGTAWSLTDLYDELAELPIAGTKGDDTLFAWADAPNTLQGLDGNDTLYGFNGNDRLIGDAGNDGLYGSSGNDTLDGGLGNDRLDGQENDDTLLGGNGSDTLGGGNGDDQLDGGTGADLLAGDAGNDWLKGYNDGDTLYGGAGDDTLLGGHGDDVLFGESGNDSLDGGLGNDGLSGGWGDDVLQGNNGNDVLVSDGGCDQLSGGAGADVFRFFAEAGYAPDVITDFNKGQDLIDLSAIDADSATATKESFSFIGTQAFNNADATAQLRFDPASHLLLGSTDADSQAEFAIELAGVNSLSATDLMLV